MGNPEEPVAATPADEEVGTSNGNGKAVDSTDEESPSGATSPEEEKIFSFLTGMKADLKARLPLYMDDWGRPQNFFTVLNATFFAFVIQLIPALIFAELMDRQTEGNLAIAETLLSSGIMGIIYAIFSGYGLSSQKNRFVSCHLSRSISFICEMLSLVSYTVNHW